MNSQEETLKLVIKAGQKKATARWWKLLLLGFLAGVMIALAATASTIASVDPLRDGQNFGIGKLISGAVFAGGLIMVVLGGAELFTGNSLMIVGWLKGKLKVSGIIKNWLIVYFANLVGSLFVVGGAAIGGIFRYNHGAVGELASSIATSKVGLDFTQALVLGIFCNLLVCLAVWFAFAAKSVPGKVLGIFFPILLFIVCGFEHSIANMYYLPAGLLAGAEISLGQICGNLLPVTLGNIIGGGILVAGVYTAVIKEK